MLADLRDAAQVGVPPSRYLGLAWASEWGPFDCTIHRALRHHDRALCDCGHGLFVDECEAATFEVQTRECGARRALHDWQESNKDTPPYVVPYLTQGDPYRQSGANAPVFD